MQCSLYINFKRKAVFLRSYIQHLKTKKHGIFVNKDLTRKRHRFQSIPSYPPSFTLKSTRHHRFISHHSLLLLLLLCGDVESNPGPGEYTINCISDSIKEAVHMRIRL